MSWVILPVRAVNCWMRGAVQQARPTMMPMIAQRYFPDLELSRMTAMNHTRRRQAAATAYMRCAWAATDPVIASTGHHCWHPDRTAQPAASAAMKNIVPNHGFQMGTMAIPGLQAMIPRIIPLASTAPSSPEAAHAASIASEAATMHHTAPPHSTPCAGCRWTGNVSSQNCSGPRSYTPCASRVASPTICPCALRTSHERSAMTALSETGIQALCRPRISASMKGVHAARCATDLTTTAPRKRSLPGAVPPWAAESGVTGGSGSPGTRGRVSEITSSVRRLLPAAGSQRTPARYPTRTRTDFLHTNATHALFPANTFLPALLSPMPNPPRGWQGYSAGSRHVLFSGFEP